MDKDEKDIALVRVGSAHYILKRRAPEGESAIPTVGELNSLLRARNFKALIRSIGALPPLFPSTDQIPLIGSSQAVVRPDPELMAREVPSYTGMPIRPLTDRIIEEFPCRWTAGGMTTIEAISDWALARNLLGLTAKLIWSAADFSDPMTRTGFTYDKRVDCWVFRVGYNPNIHASRQRLGLSLAEALSMGEKASCEAICNDLMGWGSVRRLGYREAPHRVKTSCVSFLVTDVSAACIESEAMGAGLYLCCPAVGGQTECARWAVNSIVDSVASMRSPSDGSHLGWSEETAMRFANPPAPSFIANSAFAEMMRLIVYRGSGRIAVCAECGAAIMQGVKGPLKDWCSPACRMAWFRRDARRRPVQGLHAMAGTQITDRGRSDA
ncbi:hypothetical protein [Collinsella intestinalis]|uniref:hypothetical protein n=1 Tax=Collinsella intestinalis TaxID=147207 RepID=UPI002672B97B|nr:hypothetical protein [Collinsella intestinalis]